MSDNKFDYNDIQLGYWAKRIASRFPKLTSEKFIEIIEMGTEGKWKGKYESNMCLSVIIGWIEKFREETIEKAKSSSDALKIDNEKLYNEARAEVLNWNKPGTDADIARIFSEKKQKRDENESK